MSTSTPQPESEAPRVKGKERGGWGQVLKTTLTDFFSDNAMQLAAALAYYVIFSIAPLLMIAIAVSGWLYGEQAVSGELYGQLQGYVGEEGATLIESMVKRASRPGDGTMASIIAIVTLVVGATGVTSQLKASLNAIWDVEPSSRSSVVQFLFDRLLGLGMVLCVGLLLIALVAVSTMIGYAQEWTGQWIGLPNGVVQWANNLASLVLVALLFAAMFRFLPDVRVGWRHALVGAAVTSVLFALGRAAFSWYLGRGAISGSYGAAGSVIVVLLWAYYASLILFLGAEFTQAHSRVFGKPAAESERPA